VPRCAGAEFRFFKFSSFPNCKFKCMRRIEELDDLRHKVSDSDHKNKNQEKETLHSIPKQV